MTEIPSPPLKAAELLDRATIEQPYALYARLRREAPVAELDVKGVFAVSTWALIEEALGREDDFSANLTGFLYTDELGKPEIFSLGDIDGSAGAVIATADEPEHAVHRGIVQPGMMHSAIAALEPLLRGWVVERTQAMLREGGGDYAARIAEPIPTMAMASLLGLPDADCDRLQVWAMTGGDMLAGTTTPTGMARLGAQTGAMAAYLSDRIEAGLSGQGLIGALARAVDAQTIGLSSAVGIAIVLVGAGGESTASLVGNAVRMLAEHPELQAELRASPRKIPRLVEETLRLESPFQFHYRVVRRDCALAGVRLTKGARLMLFWASANRDETIFEHAQAIDLERRFPKRHLGFGRGQHFCLGAPLARLEARIAIEELLSRSMGIEVDSDHPPTHIPSLFVRRLEHLYLNLEPGSQA